MKDKTATAPAKSGRGRPKTLNGDVQNINLHIETTLCDRIDEMVARSSQFKSRSDFVREAIRQMLDSPKMRLYYHKGHRATLTEAEKEALARQELEAQLHGNKVATQRAPTTRGRKADGT